MEQDAVVAAVVRTLRRAGWQHTPVCNGCFDLLTRGDAASVVVKVHANVDSATRGQTAEMKQAARFLSAAPLIVGDRNSRGELEKQVVYERYGVPTINPETLEAYLTMREQAVVMNKRGGYYVSLDTEKIEEQRKKQDYSVNALATEVGVSAKTIRNYRENGVATVEKARRLEEVLGDVVAGIDIFDTDVSVTTSGADGDIIGERLQQIGFEVSEFNRAPFDIGVKDADDRFVAKKEGDEEASTELLLEIRELAENTPFLVTDRVRDRRIPTVRTSDLSRMRSPDELKDALR